MGQSRFLFRSQRLAVAALASHPGGSSLLPFPPSPWGDGPGVRALCSPFGRGAGGGGCWRESLDRHQRRQTVSFVLPFSPSPLPPSPFSLSPLPLLPPSLRHVRIRGVRDSRAAKRLLISDFREQWRDWVNHHQWSPMVREKKQGSTTYYRMEVPCGKVSRTVVLARRDPMVRLVGGCRPKTERVVLRHRDAAHHVVRGGDVAVVVAVCEVCSPFNPPRALPILHDLPGFGGAHLFFFAVGGLCGWPVLAARLGNARFIHRESDSGVL